MKETFQDKHDGTPNNSGAMFFEFTDSNHLKSLEITRSDRKDHGAPYSFVLKPTEEKAGRIHGLINSIARDINTSGKPLIVAGGDDCYIGDIREEHVIDILEQLLNQLSTRHFNSPMISQEDCEFASRHLAKSFSQQRNSKPAHRAQLLHARGALNFQ